MPAGRGLWLIAATLALGGCMSAVVTSGRIEFQDQAAVFTRHDREVLAAYYRHRGPPRLAPGPVRRPVIGEPLPARVVVRSLPRELERRLSVLPPGYARGRIGPDLVLYDRRTRRVADLLAIPGD